MVVPSSRAGVPVFKRPMRKSGRPRPAHKAAATGLARVFAMPTGRNALRANVNDPVQKRARGQNHRAAAKRVPSAVTRRQCAHQ